MTPTAVLLHTISIRDAMGDIVDLYVYQDTSTNAIFAVESGFIDTCDSHIKSPFDNTTQLLLEK